MDEKGPFGVGLPLKDGDFPVPSINLVVTDNWQKGQGYTKPYHSSVMYIVVVHGAGIFANIYLKITQFRR